MEIEIKLSLSQSQANFLMEAIALRIEHQKNWMVSSQLENVAKQITDQVGQIYHFPSNFLQRILYPIKKVNVTFYEKNPKQDPGLVK